MSCGQDPNSNTFTAYVGRQVPELKLDMPSTAIGKDYLGDSIIDATTGGSGYQLSLFGLLGISLAAEEGMEINILGLNFGINPVKMQLKLPAVGDHRRLTRINLELPKIPSPDSI